MEFNVLTECIACHHETLCYEDVIEVDGKQMILHFCEDCEREINDVLNTEW